tara:strand:- start:206 stop:1240 length:1035 start_codon:yes stop_codon:yes gene_type:complete
MKLCGSLAVQHILHIILGGVIFGLQIRQQLELERSLDNLPAISSSVAMASLAVVLLMHLVSTFMSFMKDAKPESEAMKVSRNFLVSGALIFEFISMGLQRGHLHDDDLTVAGFILGGLVLMRLLNTFLDFEDAWETVSIQCIDGMPDQPNSGFLRLLMIHLFILLAIIFDIVSLVRAEEGTTPGNSQDGHHWAQKNHTTGEFDYDADRADNPVRALSIVSLSFMILHFILYPVNRFVLKATGLDQMFLTCSGLNCLCPGKKTQIVDNCPENGNPMNRQANARAGQKKVLVSVSRLPLVRQIVSTTVLCGLAYVGGATYGLHELQYRVAALISYAAYDIIGRNKL